ncbi:uncharacterized protein (TIGR01732 family) [Salibacterium salarium]|uniref:YjcZ family sporulation protein n=1 Tax=Salibacterium salarium TaxID=284579 RepID=UPI002784320F|nr:uncharacterized protein (TIGR01732 family) [Salibacterium salarium]
MWANQMYNPTGQGPNQVGGYSSNGYGCQVGGYGGPQVGGYSSGRGKGFALIVVLFILLIIVGASKVDSKDHC